MADEQNPSSERDDDATQRQTSERDESATKEQQSDGVAPEYESALKKANKDAERLRRRLQEYEDRDKSEQEKLSERVTAAEKRAQESELRALRLEVAAAKGLTEAQARRLMGESREDLKADADDLLATFAPKHDQKPTDRRPRERLSPRPVQSERTEDYTDMDTWMRTRKGTGH